MAGKSYPVAGHSQVMKEQPGGHLGEAVAPEGDLAGPRRRDRAGRGRTVRLPRPRRASGAEAPQPAIARGRPPRRLVEAFVSQNTRRAYTGALRRLDAWLDGRPLEDATLAAVLAVAAAGAESEDVALERGRLDAVRTLLCPARDYGRDAALAWYAPARCWCELSDGCGNTLVDWSTAHALDE